MDDKDLHKKHRMRMKRRFLENGLDNFSDHEVIELLLYFGTVRKNTNEVAHRLMNRFGSFSGVLDARVNDLKNIKEIGEHNATLITLMPSIVRRYMTDKTDYSAVFTDKGAIGEYLINHYIGATRERVEILLFDNNMRMCAHMTLAEGSLEQAPISPAMIADLVFTYRAAGFILAHNHPFGSPEPSDTDLELTRDLYNIFKPLNKYLMDHIIVSEKEYKCILSDAISVNDYCSKPIDKSKEI